MKCLWSLHLYDAGRSAFGMCLFEACVNLALSAEQFIQFSSSSVHLNHLYSPLNPLQCFDDAQAQMGT